MPTPWRKGLYSEIKKIKIEGKILDLGGSRKSGYHELIGGKHSIDVVNIDDNSGLDLKFDIEKIFRLKDESYEVVTAINVLEHIYNYKNFCLESFRVLASGGKLIIGVPFLIQYHPSPNDFWRYSEATLKNILTEAGFREITIKPVGKGPFTASVQLISGLLGIGWIRAIIEFKAGILDWLLHKVTKRDLAKMYPLGYFVIAKK